MACAARSLLMHFKTNVKFWSEQQMENFSISLTLWCRYVHFTKAGEIPTNAAFAAVHVPGAPADVDAVVMKVKMGALPLVLAVLAQVN